jgi:hypothetical protein
MKSNNIPIGSRPEEDLLLCCSRMSIDSERVKRIRMLLQNKIDWLYLSQLALRHGLMPLLYRNLKATHSDAVPRETLDRLREYFLSNAARNLFLTEELHKILHLFETHGILAIPYKGPSLAASVYGDLTLRQFCDLDILIQRHDIQRARDLIIPLGYQPQFQLTGSNAKPYLESQNELSFICYDGRVVVELQWEITPRYFNFSIPPQYLWNGVDHSSRRNLGFRTLSPEIELIIISVHGTKDLWTRLLWVCDVAELVRIHEGLNWDWVLKLSKTLGSLRMVFLGLFLAKDLLDTSIPEEMMHQIEGDPMVRRLARQVRQRLFQEPKGSSGILKDSLFYLKVRERLHDRIQYCIRLAMMTTPGDWALFTLPQSLFPLYYLIRPIRLASKYGMKPLWDIYNHQR